MKEVIHTDAAPRAIGPYSQAVRAGGFVFVSGQIPLDPETGELVTGDVRVQTRRVLLNIAAILEAAGTSLEKVVRTTVYLRDLNDFNAVNEEYMNFFRDARPARTTVQVARLPRDAAVEMDVIALA
ncbi:MAG: RidA family protein [Armatimonadota bacterium]|nr:RidA family protein [Armatimonadota bacterium]MDR7439610.1 RidA family protein [Armatimonadota bacterium]MDR7562831.1 RidA family protein [Armatimonadota bacterium]MDR7568924.1 RidA family protein [Armatimonadota bacterium]MDR7602077.1 RidA family protein [Armatimonadota bacterium]